jgi:ubiquinone biosynthesis protein Coq4
MQQAINEPSSNPFRVARAFWRFIKDPANNTKDVLLVEDTFFRRKLLRRFARWEEVAERLKADPRTARAFELRPRLATPDIDALAALPPGTLGRALGQHFQSYGLNPRLFQPLPDNCDGEFVMAHLLETHDVWHIVTGFGTDLEGEFALTAFYAMQTGATATTLLLALGLANTTLFESAAVAPRVAAIAAGVSAASAAEPMFGVDWTQYWEMPLREVRNRFSISTVPGVGKGILTDHGLPAAA